MLDNTQQSCPWLLVSILCNCMQRLFFQGLLICGHVRGLIFKCVSRALHPHLQRVFLDNLDHLNCCMQHFFKAAFFSTLCGWHWLNCCMQHFLTAAFFSILCGWQRLNCCMQHFLTAAFFSSLCGWHWWNCCMQRYLTAAFLGALEADFGDQELTSSNLKMNSSHIDKWTIICLISVPVDMRV